MNAIEEALAFAGGEVAAPVDINLEIARLSALSRLDYDRERAAAAKALGVRTEALDAEVKEARAASARDGGSDPFQDVEPWPDRVEGAPLLDEIQQVVLRFSVLPAHSAPLIAAWVLHAWTHDAASISPVLAAVSPEKRCGKTTLLSTVSALVPRPMSAVNISASVLFRVIEKFAPTVLIDEADTYLTADNSGDLRGMLNGGHNRLSAYVWRSVGDDHEPRQFKVWAPKVIAMIGRLPDTLEDRALVVHLRRKHAGEQVDRFRFDRLHEFLPIRRKAARWAQDHLEDLRASDPAVPEQLHDRAQDNARPICAIADAAGGRWPKVVREALIGAAAHADDEPQSAGVLLLRDVNAVLQAGRGDGRLGSSDLVTKLCAMSESQWAEWRGGRPISTKGIATMLRKFGVSPRQDRGGSYYHAVDFSDPIQRYLPATPGKCATSATSATPSPSATEKLNDSNGRGTWGTCGTYLEGDSNTCHSGTFIGSGDQNDPHTLGPDAHVREDARQEYGRSQGIRIEEDVTVAISGIWDDFQRQDDPTDPEAWG